MSRLNTLHCSSTQCMKPARLPLIAASQKLNVCALNTCTAITICKNQCVCFTRMPYWLGLPRLNTKTLPNAQYSQACTAQHS